MNARQVSFGESYVAMLPSSWDTSCLPNALALGDVDNDSV
jgi:hypothetical protein